MNIEESIEQIGTLLDAWELDEADLNQTDLNAMQVLLNEIQKLKENAELKKQLEESKNRYINRLNNQLAEDIEPDEEDFYFAEIENKANAYDKLLKKQKEFIKYLEDESKEVYRDGGLRQNIFKQVLQKYKNILDYKDEQN